MFPSLQITRSFRSSTCAVRRYAVKAGMDPFAALQAITINPAKHIGIADRVGSIEVGKDADLVLTDGCPFEVMTNVKAVLINGAVVSQK